MFISSSIRTTSKHSNEGNFYQKDGSLYRHVSLSNRTILLEQFKRHQRRLLAIIGSVKLLTVKVFCFSFGTKLCVSWMVANVMAPCIKCQRGEFVNVSKIYLFFFFVSLSWYTKTRPITHNKSDTYIICCKPEDDLLSMFPVCVMYIVFSWESVRFWTASHDNRRFKLIISWKKSKDSTHFEVNSGLEISSKRVCAVYSWWCAFTHYRKIFARISTDPVLLLKPSITQTYHYSHYNEDTTWVVNMLLETDTYFHIISTHTILCV